jgi:hypothetical protein
VPVVAGAGGADEHVRVTDQGARHPMMRLAASDVDTLKRWGALPPLAGHLRLGAPRPGASVLAVADGTGGTSDAVVAIQRFGAGRAMVFAGEASWRWKMLMPAGDGTYERFWRQAVRWLTVEAPDALALAAPAPAADGDGTDVTAEVHDSEFRPAADATVRVRLDGPDEATSVATAALVDSSRARFSVHLPAGEPGVHRVHVDASKGGESLGAADAPWLSGGVDRELADPRLDAPALRRLAEASGGAYLAADHAGEAGQYLVERTAARQPAEWREAWHNVWVLGLVLALVSAEWTLRRQWGLR